MKQLPLVYECSHRRLYTMARAVHVARMHEAPAYPGAVPAERHYDLYSRGLRLRVYEWGDASGPPLVLCHGYWDNAHGFDLIAPLLAAHFRVVAFDARGHGDSAWVDNYHASHMIYDVVHVLEHVAAGRAIPHLLGHSFGGVVALNAACVVPQLVDKLVDIEGFGPATREYQLPGYQGTPELGSVEALRSYLAQRRTSHQFISFRPYPRLDDLVARRKRMNARLSDAWLRYFCWHGSRHGADGWRWKADPELGAGAEPFKAEWAGRAAQHLKRPMLAIVAAEQDSWGPLAPELLEERLRYVPILACTKVPATGHFPHMEEPRSTADLIIDYLQS